MQPSKITILGDFFDCQIYRGRLYLWTLSGDIYTYDWNGIIGSLETDTSVSMTLMVSGIALGRRNRVFGL